MINRSLYIAETEAKGRGVFTKKPIAANTVIEVAPVIVLESKDRIALEQTQLYYYIFEWGEDTEHGAVALGYVSIYNHASPSNCEYLMDYEARTITIQTMLDVKAGEELTINYSAGWDDWEPVWFDAAK